MCPIKKAATVLVPFFAAVTSSPEATVTHQTVQYGLERLIMNPVPTSLVFPVLLFISEVKIVKGVKSASRIIAIPRINMTIPPVRPIAPMKVLFPAIARSPRERAVVAISSSEACPAIIRKGADSPLLAVSDTVRTVRGPGDMAPESPTA